MLTLEVVRDVGTLAALTSEWRRLWESIPSSTPFQSPDWQLTWWKHFGSGELHTLVFRSKGEMCGLIPCFRHEWNGRRQLTLVGSGISDFLEPAIAADYRQPVIACLKDHLKQDKSWDVCDWQDLSSDTFLKDLAPDADLVIEVQPDLPCSEILVRDDFDAYWEKRPHGLKRNVRRYADKARQIDVPEFVVSTSEDSILTTALIRLHTARWQDHGEQGMIVANRSATFLREVVEKLSRRKMLIYFSLRFQGQVVAIIVSFPHRNVLFSYLSAFDPEYQALGFGKLLLGEALKYAFQQKYSAWNFLRGDEPYKSDWGAQPITKLRLIVKREHS